MLTSSFASPVPIPQSHLLSWKRETLLPKEHQKTHEEQRKEEGHRQRTGRRGFQVLPSVSTSACDGETLKRQRGRREEREEKREKGRDGREPQKKDKQTRKGR